MNYVLMAILAVVVFHMLYQMQYAQSHKMTVDASVPHLLDLITGGFLAMINPLAKHFAMAMDNAKNDKTDTEVKTE